MPEVGAMEAGGGSEPVPLQPFMHQVGGHTSMMKFNDTTLCKPLVPREQYFYQNIPYSLKEFTAEFRGVIEVKLHEDSEGYVTFMGYPDSTHTSPVSSSSGSDTSSLNRNVAQSTSVSDTCIRLLRSGSIEVKSQNDKLFNSEDTSSENSTASFNPWSLKCHKRTLSKMKKALGQDSESCKFILLENVAAKFSYPCVLDLKMGTRVHGDEVSEAKKQRHMMKCSNTTSSTLGARICGMQVYQASTGTYKCQNKYYGRKLSVEEFKQTLRQFLHNGLELRRELTRPIVKRLKQLAEQVSQQDTYRFYSSSLLIMYDGHLPHKRDSVTSREECSSDSSCFEDSDVDDILKIEVRMVDFAHSTFSGFQNDMAVHNGPDEGYLFGLRNLIQFFSDIR